MVVCPGAYAEGVKVSNRHSPVEVTPDEYRSEDGNNHMRRVILEPARGVCLERVGCKRQRFLQKQMFVDVLQSRRC